MVEKVTRACGGDLSGVAVAIWAPTFKAGTDDLRDSPSLDIVRRLLEGGAQIKAFDPMVRRPFPGITVCPDAYEVCADAEILLVLTEWPEFAAMDFRRVASLMATPTFVDTRQHRPDQDGHRRRPQLPGSRPGAPAGLGRVTTPAAAPRPPHQRRPGGGRSLSGRASLPITGEGSGCVG